MKTSAARRTIPIHPMLIALGFVELVEARRQAGEVRMFPVWQRAKSGTYSDIVSKEFNAPGRFLDRLGLKGPTHVLYSLRHNFKDALKRTDLKGNEEDLLMGHASGHVSEIYGSKTLYRQMLDRFIAGVDDEGLDPAQITDADGRPALQLERLPAGGRERLAARGREAFCCNSWPEI